jgi:heptosyltransferase-1
MDSFLAAHGLIEGRPRRPYALVNAGGTWITKRWPVERFAAVARGLAKGPRLAVLALWTPGWEREAAERVVKEAGSPLVFMAPATNVRQLAALTRGARLYVGNDSGPLHLAAALGVGCVAVFGASDARRNGPYGEGHRVHSGGLECQPCWRTTCSRGEAECLLRVSPEEVLASCGELLAGRGSSR